MKTSLSKDQVREIVLAALRDFLGEKAPKTITDSTDPIKDLGLDSPDGVDFACVLSELLGCEVPKDLNPLVDDARHCGRRVGAMIELLFELVEKSSHE